MRRSSQNTSVAVLRAFIDTEMKKAGRPGMSQQEFADIIGKAVSTVQSLETGRLKLSNDTAKRISLDFGVQMGWLILGNLTDPIRSLEGTPYTLENFERARFHKDVSSDYGEPSDATISRAEETLSDIEKFLDVLGYQILKSPDAEFWAFKLQTQLYEFQKEYLKENRQYVNSKAGIEKLMAQAVLAAEKRKP